MDVQEMSRQLEALKEENLALKAQIRQSMTAGLVEAFAYGSDTFDLERSDFRQLTGVRFRGNCFFSLLFRERRISSRLLQFDSESMQVIAHPTCSFQDMEAVIRKSFHSRHILLITPSKGNILTVVNFSLLPGDFGNQAIQELEDTAREINRNMNLQFGFAFDVFISGVHFDAKNVCLATRDCEYVRDYSQLLGSGKEPQIL